MSIFGPGRLVRENATITIEVPIVTQDADSGGTVDTWASLVTGIKVLITQNASNRAANFGTDAERTALTVTGVDTRMNRSDARFLITASDSQSEIVGWYLRIEKSTRHPEGAGGLLTPRIECDCTKLELPAALLDSPVRTLETGVPRLLEG